MKTLAVIGKGRTGGEVLKELAGENIILFDQHHPVNVEALQQAEAAIVFVPGTAVADIFDLILESKIPVVWGSTGYNWPSDLNAQLAAAEVRWVIAANFSPMNLLIRKMLNLLHDLAPDVLDHPVCHIHEVHHVHKKDQPSGTALSWQEWVGLPATITSSREREVLGMHNLTLQTADETLSLSHESQSRRMYAQGAVWAMRYLMKHSELAPGLYTYHQLFDLYLADK